jgi:hypothetical protein
MPFRPLTPEEQKTWVNERPCMHPEHNPPSHIVLQPGLHVWVCPGCGQETSIAVPQYY